MLKNYFDLIRVPQWIKNLFVFVPLLFSMNLFEAEYFLISLKGFFIFCFASSFIYIINDIVDLEADANHPKKKNRPLPSGRISKKNALSFAFIILIILVSLTFTANSSFNYFLLGFVTLNILYSFYFKHIVILDVFSIATGFS
ncbi:MAG: UbiA family prenyltransferase, partial [Ignavibacteriaceae bacterium]|nr:UbiA family prenyltransferase [Ignavibacteriaceae bacterium]